MQQFDLNSLEEMFAVSKEYNVQQMPLGNLGLVAGSFDAFNLENVIESAIGKIGSHVKLSSAKTVKCLLMQMLNVPYQSLSGTEEYYQEIPLKTLINQDNAEASMLNRHEISRVLDAIDEFGPERLFVRCSEQVARSLNLKVTETHVDSTSFHYDGETREEDECELRLDKGYSRDHRPDLNQVIALMMCDGKSHLPIYSKAISGHVNDAFSFRDLMALAVPQLLEQFKELKYVVGDSALCSAETIQWAQNAGIDIVTRIPDKYKVVRELMEQSKVDEMEIIYPDDEEVRGKWGGEIKVGNQSVRLLLVNNEAKRQTKEQTIRKRALKERNNLNAAIKKMQTQPAKCLADAQKAVEKLQHKTKLCTIENIEYESVMKNASRGRPKEDAQKIVDHVKVKADVNLNEELILKHIDSEVKYVICTTDLKREWTMADLLGTYKRQSVVERGWRITKDPRFMIDAIYLKSPRRINALMWLMTMALMLYVATEYKIREIMATHRLTIPGLGRTRAQERPTLRRLFQYMGNSSICLVRTQNMSSWTMVNIPDSIVQILIRLGIDWARYYLAQTYSEHY